MSIRLTVNFLLLLLAAASASHTANAMAEKPLPSDLAGLGSVLADAGHLERGFQVPSELEAWEEGAELPPVVIYRTVPDDGTFAALTDRKLCRRPAEGEICDAFLAMIAGKPPAMGSDVTGSRLESSGAATVYLVPLPGVKLAGADADGIAAFIGGDTQSDPPVDPALYVYARRGSLLLELHAPLGPCDFPVPDEFWQGRAEGKELATEAEVRQATNAYYLRACVNPGRVARAQAVARRLVATYALTR